jgi:hypothetical protein
VGSTAVDAAVVEVAAVSDLVLGAHSLAGEAFLLRARVLLGLLFLVRSVATLFEISWRLPFAWPYAPA